MLQGDSASASLRATGKVGEQADGYLGVVGSADGSLRAQVDAVNIKRRAYYTDLAAKRNTKIEEVAAATGRQLLSSTVQPGPYYRLPDRSEERRVGQGCVRPCRARWSLYH